GPDRGRAPPEPALRRRAAAARLVLLRARRAREGARPHHRPRQGSGDGRPRHRVLGRVVLRHGGPDRPGSGVGPPRGLDRQRELSAVRAQPQARQPAPGPPLRLPHGRPPAPLGGAPRGAEGSRALSAPRPDLLLLSTSTVYGTAWLEHAFPELRAFLGGVRRVLFVPFAIQDQDGYAAR